MSIPEITKNKYLDDFNRQMIGREIKKEDVKNGIDILGGNNIKFEFNMTDPNSNTKNDVYSFIHDDVKYWAVAHIRLSIIHEEPNPNLFF